MPNALYVARDGLQGFAAELDQFLAQMDIVFKLGAEFNIIKFRTGELKISFLSYPRFMDDPHPALRRSVTIDLATGKARDIAYDNNSNPPILHRKEAFLPAGHPLHGLFAALTRAEEEAGLYEQTATIGFKLNWERLLEVDPIVKTTRRDF